MQMSFCFVENTVALAPNITAFNMYSPRFPCVRTDWGHVDDGWKIEQTLLFPRKGRVTRVPRSQHDLDLQLSEVSY